MKAEFWIIIEGKRAGYHLKRIERGQIRTSIRKPSVGRMEIPLKLNVEIPDELFTGPNIEVNLSVPSRAPLEISGELQAQIAEQIQNALGVTAHVSVSDGGEE